MHKIIGKSLYKMPNKKDLTKSAAYGIMVNPAQVSVGRPPTF